ncbi:MAG: winged helix-turn-helix transcriptional regulator [Chloroflexi bacterium]|nr:MAG: winged helix-turn-helix transcriptional regulator [Chloroflexota bacterium]
MSAIAPRPAAPPAADAFALARFFRVLADPTRLRIITLLGDGERTVGEIVQAVGGLQPRVSAHLACLRHCGFVETERRGREVIYRLSVDRLGRLLALGANVAAPRAEHLATCDRIGPDWV